MIRASLVVFLLFTLLLSPISVFAEGVVEMGATQRLFAQTVLFVDIVDSTTETFSWTGVTAADSTVNVNTAVTITVTDPNGTSLGTFPSGTTSITPTPGVNGAYRIAMSSVDATDVLSNYDVTVSPATEGRLHSTNWFFDASTFTAVNASNSSFYAVVDGGNTDNTAVIELKLEGLAGNRYEIVSNNSGVDGASSGRSIREVDGSVTSEHKIYLNPPTNATYSTITPEVTNFLFQGLDANGVTKTVENCRGIIPGATTGRFSFDSNVTGRYRITCDLNGDETFDIASDDDMTLRGDVTEGTNTVIWDGTDNSGNFVRDGSYSCLVSLSVGDFHYVGRDIETSYPGLRLFTRDTSLNRIPLRMYWNDSDVQGTADAGGAGDSTTMPNGEVGLETSGPDGVHSGTFADTTVANSNARSWGNFNAAGRSKGNLTFLDTYTFIEATASTTLIIIAVNSTTADADFDTLSNFDEICEYGTDPNLCDTDGDCLCDGTEVNTTSTDPLVIDSDGDGVSDGVLYTNLRDITGASCDAVSLQGGGFPIGSCHLTPNQTNQHPIVPALVFFIVTLLLALLRKKQTLFLLLLILLSLTNKAEALNTQSLKPSTGGVPGFHLFTSELILQDDFAIAIMANYNRQPFEISTTAVGTNRLVGIVDDFVTTDIVFSYGANANFNITMGFPLNIFHNVAPTFIVNRDSGFIDAGDLWLNGKILLRERNEEEDSRFGLALVPFLTIPTGRESIHFGDESVTGGGWLVADTKWKENLFYLNFGGRFRHAREQILNLSVRNEFLFGLGFHRPLVKKWNSNLHVELFGSTTYSKFFSETISTPTEALVVFQKKCFRKKPFIFHVGGGTGVSAGYGTPDARGLLGITYVFEQENSCAPPPPPPKPIPTKFIRLKEKIHFYTDSSDIMPRSFPTLDHVAKVLRSHAEIKKVQIQGHTDSRGTDRYNQSLSERRAKSVYDYLINHGVNSDRLTWVGHGESKPIATNETVGGRAKNRRTVLKILEIDPKKKRKGALESYEKGNIEFKKSEETYDDT